MPIELSESWVGHRKIAGVETFTLPAGKWLKVEDSPDGEEHLYVQVPAGKEWTVSVYVDIKETDL